MKGEFIMGNKYDQAYEDFLKMFDREPKMDPNLNYNGILMEDQFLTIDIPEDTYIRMNELKKDPPKIRDNFIATLCTFHREIYGENAGQLRKRILMHWILDGDTWCVLNLIKILQLNVISYLKK